MPDIWTKLKNTNKKIVLYGTGNGADKIMNKLIEEGIKVDGIFASDGFVRDREFRGIKVQSYASAKEQFGDMIVLMCFGSSRPEVLEFVEKIRGENEFYLPDVPVYGDVIFDDSYYENNKEELLLLENGLSDSLSKKTLKNLIDYKLSGDIKYLYEVETTLEEEESLIDIKEHSVLIDCGAYNGDTVRKYTRVYGSKLDRIIALEPDKRSFRKLQKFADESGDRRIIPINSAVSVEDGEMHLFDNTGRGVHLSGNSQHDQNVTTNAITEVVTIDSIVEKYASDIEGDILIKFDVEGDEVNAIKGCIDTIRNRKPKLIVSCYHRNDDFITIPSVVKGIREDYRLRIRHLPGLPSWDTQFYFD
ncbi:MAG: FkbM family methyltransferase [Clostridia bacterium]|nr:FkbM family methyltransferase [Clostridia bacterium]